MKERCSKKRIHVVDNTKEISTLDDIHINSIKKFEVKNNRIEEITEQINKLNIISMTDISWLSNVEIKEQIKDYTTELDKLNSENELDYYENVGEILFNYYDIVNQNVGVKQVNPKKYTILEALNIEMDNSNSIGEYKDKSKLVNEYLAITDNKYINHMNGEFTNAKCLNCNNEMTNLVQEALIVCFSCGYQDVLLAEQNTTVALRHADYGYILENGRIVMDGPAKELASNEDVKEFYLGISGSGRKSFRDGKHYRRRKRWLA